MIASKPRAALRWQIDSTLLTAATIFTSALMLYVLTGAPSVLSGDQAEHQWTAWTVGVPHATGYPLFTMLNAIAAHLLPFGDVARRVTVMTALYSALAVTAAFGVVRTITRSNWAGALAALTLAASREFWQLSVIAEVYTLQALFIVLALWTVWRWWRIEDADLALSRRGLRHPLVLASVISGLGATHHGSFTPIVAPAMFATIIVPLLMRLRDRKQRRAVGRLFGRCVLWALIGLAPWLYLAAQYILFRPFDYYRGEGLPVHIYWGNPHNWGDVLNLALGAGFRLKVFTHGWGHLAQLLPSYLIELRAQVGWLGIGLGVIGAIAAWRRSWRLGAWTTLVWLGGSFFGLNVAADVPKAHAYYLPAWLMWALWIGLGGWTVAHLMVRIFGSRANLPHSIAGLLLLVLIVLGPGRSLVRYPQRDRSADWHYRQQATAILAAVEPNAVILCRWEDCMTLRYVQFVDGLNPHVQLDQTEPEAGINWAERVPIYAPLPIYFVRFNAQLGEQYRVLPIERVPDELLWQVLP